MPPVHPLISGIAQPAVNTPPTTSTGSVSAGFYVGIGVFIIGTTIALVVYGYFANPFPFHRLKERLGFQSSGRTPISRKINWIEPSVWLRNGYIVKPQPAHCSDLTYGSLDCLPMYTPDPDFSKEVLMALMKVHVFGMELKNSRPYHFQASNQPDILQGPSLDRTTCFDVLEK
jgi:hypothetical protein